SRGRNSSPARRRQRPGRDWQTSPEALAEDALPTFCAWMTWEWSGFLGLLQSANHGIQRRVQNDGCTAQRIEHGTGVLVSRAFEQFAAMELNREVGIFQ